MKCLGGGAVKKYCREEAAGAVAFPLSDDLEVLLLGLTDGERGGLALLRLLTKRLRPLLRFLALQVLHRNVVVDIPPIIIDNNISPNIIIIIK
jgi:hypothetical protein